MRGGWTREGNRLHLFNNDDRCNTCQEFRSQYEGVCGQKIFPELGTYAPRTLYDKWDRLTVCGACLRLVERRNPERKFKYRTNKRVA
jgi:hypothetical protein